MASGALQRGGQGTASRFLAALALAVCGLAAAPASAQQRADYAPGNLEFVVPDKWSVETSKQKLTLVAPDENGFVQFAPLQPGNDAQLRTQVAQALATYLADIVLADPGDSTQINGMPGFRVSGTASSDATPVQFTALVVSAAANRPVLVLAYASQESFATHGPTFEAVVKSLKRR